MASRRRASAATPGAVEAELVEDVVDFAVGDEGHRRAQHSHGGTDATVLERSRADGIGHRGPGTAIADAVLDGDHERVMRRRRGSSGDRAA